MKATTGSALLAAAGLLVGAVAWSLHQQISYVAASWMCGSDTVPMLIFFGLATALLIGGAWLSRRARSSLSTDDHETGESGRPRHFLVAVSFLGAALFFFAISLQAGAAFFLPGCR